MLKTLLILLAAQSSVGMAQNLVEIRCDAEPDTRAKMSELVHSVLSESLAKFDELNPLVSEALRYRLQTRKLMVTCDGREKLKNWGAEADSSWRLLGPYRIRLGLTAAEIIGSVSQKNTILHEILHYARIDNFKTRAHNSVWESGLIAQDNVYACADTVYPELFVNNPVQALEAAETCENALKEE